MSIGYNAIGETSIGEILVDNSIGVPTRVVAIAANTPIGVSGGGGVLVPTATIAASVLTPLSITAGKPVYTDAGTSGAIGEEAIGEGKASFADVLLDSAATISTTGQLPLVGGGVVIDIPVATASLSTTAPSVVGGGSFVVNVASIAVSGQVPDVTSEPGPLLDAAAIIGVSSNVPDILTGTSVDVGRKIVAVAAIVPDEIYANVVPTSSIATVGLVPVILSGSEDDIGTAAISVAGQTPSVSGGSFVAVPTTPIIGLSQYAPSLFSGASIAASLATIGLSAPLPAPGGVTIIPIAPQPVGYGTAIGESAIGEFGVAEDSGTPSQVPTVRITANAPSILAGTAFNVGVASAIGLTANAPQIQTGSSVTVGSSGLVGIAAIVPELGSGALIDIPTRTATVGRNAPTIVGGSMVDVAAKAIATTGLNPISVDHSANVAVPTAIAAMAANAPSISAGSLTALPTPPVIAISRNAPTILAGSLIQSPVSLISTIGMVPEIDSRTRKLRVLAIAS